MILLLKVSSFFLSHFSKNKKFATKTIDIAKYVWYNAHKRVYARNKEAKICRKSQLT